MNSVPPADVVVIGAGPVGLTLANELTRHGSQVRIVDRAPGIRQVSKAMILHVRTQEILDKVGIEARVQREAQPLREVVVHAYGKHIGSWDLDDIDSPFPCPLIHGQNKTQAALLDLLESRGGSVDWNTEAVSFTVDADGVTLALRSTGAGPAEETVRARWVVGCDGSNSFVRRTLGLSFEGERYTGEQFIQADCRIRWGLPTGRSYLFLTRDGYMMVIEFPDGVVRIFISLPDENAAAARQAMGEAGAVEAVNEQPTLDEIAHHLTRLTGFACSLSDPIWLARYRTSHRYTNRFSAGRAFVAGDAAHVHVPIGGQGMNTGIQDAFNLGWKLAGVARGALRPEVLDSYHAERYPVAEALIHGTDFAYRGILHPSELRQRAVRLFGPFLIRNNRVQNFMRTTLEELRVFYPNSPLNLDLGGIGGPAPGERALDADLVRAADQTTVSLNELLRSIAWTLLLFGDVDAGVATRMTSRFAERLAVWSIRTETDAAPPERLLLDTLRIAHDRYGAKGPAFVLLRPDTYIAARGPADQLPALMTHLDRIFT